MSAAVRLASATAAVAPTLRAAILHRAATAAGFTFHLGLDVSSSHVGCALLSTNGAVLRSSVCVNRARADIFDFAVAACAAIDHARGDAILESVTVEEALKAFAGGRCSAQSIFKLGQLNAIIVHEMRRRASVCAVHSVTPNAVRALWGIADKVRADAGSAAAAADNSVDADEAGHAGGGAADDGTAVGLSPGSPAKVAFPAAPASANATKVAAMRVVSSAFPGLLGIWGQGRRRGTRTGVARASDFDRSDAVLLAMTGAVHSAEAACLADGAVIAAAATAASPFLLRPHEARKGGSGDAAGNGWPPERIAARLCVVHSAAQARLAPSSPVVAKRGARSAVDASAGGGTDAAAATAALPREGAVYDAFRAAVRAGVVRALLEGVWTGGTAVEDAGG